MGGFGGIIYAKAERIGGCLTVTDCWRKLLFTRSEADEGELPVEHHCRSLVSVGHGAAIVVAAGFLAAG